MSEENSDSSLATRAREDLWGVYVVARREFFSNLMSIRSLVMVVILALFMLGAAMGFTAPTSVEEANLSYVYHVLAMDADGRVDDLVVFVYDADTLAPEAGIGVELLLESAFLPELAGETGPDGLFAARNLTAAFHMLEVDIPEEDRGGFTPGTGIQYVADTGPAFVYIPHNVTIPTPPNSTVPPPLLFVVANTMDTSGNELLDDVFVQVLGPGGAPAAGATVAVAGQSGTTDGNGVASFEAVEKGVHNVTASASGLMDGVTQVNVTHEETEFNPFAVAEEGPDKVLGIVASIAIGLMGPVYAIVLSFDTISREKLSGSIDYLLVRPMGRRAVVTGKFIGVLAALMVPLTAVSLAGVGLIAWRSGEAPSAMVLLGFLALTTLLISIFTLLQLIFSTLAKTTGTAVLSGVGLWIFFFMLYNIIVFVVALLKDLEGDALNDFLVRSSLYNPIGLYDLSMTVLVDGSAGAAIPNWQPPTIMLLLTVAILLVAIEVFRRRVTE